MNTSMKNLHPLFLWLIMGSYGWVWALGQAPDMDTCKGNLIVASCQFPVSGNISENAGWIMNQMKEASLEECDLVHFPECALSGYPGVDHEALEGFDWIALRRYSDSISSLAKELGIWVVLGSMHPLGDDYKPMNSLYVINPLGEIIDRYDKRFCTQGDLKFFSAGGHFTVFEIKGVKCGLLICYDVRFPELYREYRKMGVDLIFQSFYNARQKTPSIHPLIMPVTAQARAATNYFYMSLTNSSSPLSWPCHFISPDGLVEHKLEPDIPGILVSKIDLSEEFYDASRDFRGRAMSGELSSEEVPEHKRYHMRKGL